MKRHTHQMLVLGVAAAAVSATAAFAAVPRIALFTTGYNKCKSASVTAMTGAAQRKISRARFDGKTCTWSGPDGTTILVDTHPSGYIELLGPSLGKHANGDVAKTIKVPGASKAVLETFSHKNTGRYAKDLLVAYPQGVVQVSSNYATPFADGVIVAVLRLVTHT